jgi:hypothetical protein
MDYESLVTLGQAAAEVHNSSVWALGTYAREAQALGYTLNEYGAAVGKSGSQLSEYACMVEYYQVDRHLNAALNERIWELKQTHLCYTLFRDAKKLGVVYQSVCFLERCLSEGWSVDKARAVLADIKAGKPVIEMWTAWEGIDLDSLSARDIASHVEQHIRALRQAGHQVRIKVYGVGERVTAT